MGSLLQSFRDALGGQLLAQPGMLVVHGNPLSWRACEDRLGRGLVLADEARPLAGREISRAD